MSITNFYADPHSATFLVAKDDQAVALSPNAVGAVDINDYTNDLVNIADGQLGILIKDEQSARKDTLLVAGETYADFKKLQLIQGTPASSDISQVDAFRRGDQSYVKSNIIDFSQGQLAVISKPFKQSRSSAWVIGDVAGNPGEILPIDNVTYALRIGFGGRKQMKRFSQAGVNRMYTTIEKELTSYTNDVDRFIKRLVAKINHTSSLQSRGHLRKGGKPGIVLAVNIAGGAGVALSTINTGNLGNKVNYQLLDGKTLSLVITEDLIETVTEIIANTGLTSASTIELVDLSVAGAVAMGAGAAAADAMIVLALDDKPAANDDRMETQKATIMQVGFEGLPYVLKEVGSTTYRGQGRGWQLYNDYLKRAMLEVFAEESMPLHERPASLPPVYFADDMSKYNVHEVYHTWIEYKDVQRIERNNRIVILEPIADTATKASLNASLAVYLNSAPNLVKYTDATAPALFS